MLFRWFTPVLTLGDSTPLVRVEQLAPLPPTLASWALEAVFEAILKTHHDANHNPNPNPNPNSHPNPNPNPSPDLNYRVLLHTVLRCGWSTIFVTGLLKLWITALTFAGPILLGYMVSFLEDSYNHDPTPEEVYKGVFLVGLLTGSAALVACLSTNYNMQLALLKLRLQGSLTRMVFDRSINLTIAEWNQLELQAGQVSNFVQIDVDQVADCFRSIHELWSLPLQLAVTFVLLYLKIKLAFFAGVFVIVVMLPVNSYIARRIGSSTRHLMEEKDSRIRLITVTLTLTLTLTLTVTPTLTLIITLTLTLTLIPPLILPLLHIYRSPYSASWGSRCWGWTVSSGPPPPP